MNSALTPSVIERLQLERARIESGAFSSSLGVGEMLLARKSGYRVLGQVMGAVAMQFGRQYFDPDWLSRPWLRPALEKQMRRGHTLELTALAQSFSDARELALLRLKARARELGADGIVAVTLQARWPEQDGNERSEIIEFVATGTAIVRGASATQKLFLSSLSCAESWKLERAGYAPCAIVMGQAIILRTLSPGARSEFGRTRFKGWRGNFEVLEYSQVIHKARRRAMSLVKFYAKKCGATGVLGLQVAVEKYPEERYLREILRVEGPRTTFSVFAIGTAIRPLPGTDAPAIQPILDIQ